MFWSDAVFIFLVPMLLFFLLQIPFWGIRACFGWTIISPWSKPDERRQLRFTLAHVFGWSVFLAVPLCILPVFVQGTWRSAGSGLLFLCFWAVILCVLLMWFLYVALAANFGMWKSIAASTLVLVLAVAAQLTVISFWERIDAEVVLMLVTVNFPAGAVLLLCLSLAHRLGFRLRPFEARRLLQQSPQANLPE